jgi:alginate O-acetyltransferase complex protein AlgI
MRPTAFVEPWGPPRRGAGRLAIEGAAFAAAGAGLLLLARELAARGTPPRVAAFLALAALFLVVPFGVFRGLAGLWRGRGVPVGPPMDAPHRSRSLTEFWGRRWNRPFSEMGQLAVHRPLRRRLGPGPAAFAVFLFSGLLHEVVLSVPARGGYGLPTAYFALQGGLVALERRMGLGRPGVRPAWGRAWTVAAVVLPAPVLFHAAFLDACVVPLLGRG